MVLGLSISRRSPIMVGAFDGSVLAQPWAPGPSHEIPRQSVIGRRIEDGSEAVPARRQRNRRHNQEEDVCSWSSPSIGEHSSSYPG